ncbi:phosphatidylglycerophosphatase A family protein [Geminicoccus roseus]|uniref:phosphatidylglycerophosphatase A family protein n=1 Tax=Geminicoccus roseus TaxID=404900 RepID=UPI0003F6A493|nr:phosphatidylglycerophosphatase A [Geminicoccus roseus]
MTSRSIEMLITWFGSGYIKPASGTWGSLAALPFGIVLHWAFGPLALGVLALLLYGVGVILGGVYLITAEHPDPDDFVLDEVVGQWLALAAAPLTFLGVIVAFLLFRVLDITKPWPACWIDRRMHGALGVMTDDLVAGIYAALLVFMVGSYL